MAHPRGARVRSFPTSSRAVCLEAEWKIDMSRVATELKPLMKAARDQGWTITDANGSKLVWRGPNGEGPVYTGYRINGRDLYNYAAELRRNGLKLDDENDKKATEQEDIEKVLEIGQSVTIKQITDAMDIVSGGVSVLVAKAMGFDELKKEVEEYNQLVQEASAEIDSLRAKNVEMQTKLDAIYAAFGLAGWAVLPEIAKILNIDATNPTGALPMRDAG